MVNNNLGPVHKASLEKNGKDWTKPGKLVSNGAYVLKDWQVNNRVVIEKNPQYWDAANVQLTKVTYLPIEDGYADVKLYESGENEYVYQLPPGTYEKYKASTPRKFATTHVGLALLLVPDQNPAFKDVRVRKALSMVMDRDILSKRVTADGQAPAYSLSWCRVLTAPT
jgi:oligopeptide transport system substrate-binding protein